MRGETTRRFLITGLPRSRTAWFSVATTTPKSVCLHEPTALVQSFEELMTLWTPSLGIASGISDSCLPLYLGRILEEAKPRTLIIERNPVDVINSYTKFAERVGILFDVGLASRWMEEFQDALDACKGSPLVKCVPFDALVNVEVVRNCLAWLLPDEDFPDLQALMDMNVQIDAAHFRAMSSLPHSQWHLNP